MRNQDAARYARWAAYAAALIALIVAGVYARRAIQAARARQQAPPPIPESVQQESAEFSYVGTDQGRQLLPSVLRTLHNIKTRIARCSKTSGSPSTATTAAATTTFTPANVITNPPAATSSARVTSRSISRAPLPLPASPPTRTCKSPRAISPSIARAATPPLPRRCNFASRKALAMPTE